MSTQKTILLTTSRRPTRRIRILLHDLTRSLPNTVSINRGKMSTLELAEETVKRGLHRVIIIDRAKGGPGEIRFYEMGRGTLVSVPPQIYIKGIKLQRDYEGREKTIGSLIMSIKPQEKSSDATRLLEFLSDFLGLPFIETQRARTDCEATMQMYKDETQLTHLSFFLLPRMTEIGAHIVISHPVWDIP